MSTHSRPPLQMIMMVAGAVTGLAILVAAAAVLYLVLTLKTQVESTASAALGVDLKVAGRSTLGIFPRPHVKLDDVQIRKAGADIAAAREVDLGIALLPLLRHDVQVKRISLKGLRIRIERDHSGKLNLSTTSTTPWVLPALTLADLSASDMSVSYANQSTGERVEISDCALHVDHLTLPQDAGSSYLSHLSVAAKLVCGQLKTTAFVASDLAASLTGQAGIFNVDPISVHLFGGLGSGSVHADYAAAMSRYRIHAKLTQFRMEQFFKSLSTRNVGTGLMDFSANLTLHGPISGTPMQTVAGEASLNGKNLRLAIGDLDEKFARYEASQNFNLMDVGAVLVAGPLGLAVTKGFNFARVFQGAEGITATSTLVSQWQVEHGIAHAGDVAMATAKNRVALTGGLDFVQDRFDDVTMALIDADGCPQVVQKIRGSFANPQIEAPSVLSGLTGPTRKLFAKAKKLLGGKCVVFYRGSVAAPK